MSQARYFSSIKEKVVESQQLLSKANVVLSSTVTLREDTLTDTKFLVYISFAEIYNEEVFDLLRLDSKKRPKLNIIQDAKGNPFIPGLAKIWVSSVEEALLLFYLGCSHLCRAPNTLNERSSRSHCIFRICVIKVIDSKSVLACVNNLSFCDLAGSERVSLKILVSI